MSIIQALLVAVFYALFIKSRSVTPFSPPTVPIVANTKLAVPLQLQLVQPLRLHPDQAQELEAAASEVFAPKKQDQDEDDVDDIVEESSIKYQDDTKHNKEPPLSAASATSSSSYLKGKCSWSRSFFAFISRYQRK
jgi:hypothetical protein